MFCMEASNHAIAKLCYRQSKKRYAFFSGNIPRVGIMFSIGLIQLHEIEKSLVTLFTFCTLEMIT